jgi:ribokinase
LPSVTVLGSLHLDIMVDAPGVPLLGETMVGTAMALKPGGKGGNQAVAAARHGASVAMVGAVGEDAFAPPLLDHLRALGVDIRHVARLPAASGMSVALTEPSGDYRAVIVSGVNLTLDDASVAAAAPLIAGARWLVLQNEVPEAANIAAARVARAHGCQVLLNAAPARALPPALAELLDILVVNALEAQALADGTAAALLALAPCAIVTAGGEGVTLATRAGETLTLPAHAIEVRSTHGAGDTFVGALTARLAAGDALAAALRYANAAAAVLVSGAAHTGPAAVHALLTEAGP